MAAKPPIITIEEHYWDAEIVATFGADRPRGAELTKRLEDVGALRLKEMDEAGIDVQLLSHGAPAVQHLDPATAVPLARGANDRLKAIIDVHPTRLAGFAMLPTPDPKGAADELERSVNKLGFKGAMIHGLSNGRFLDEKQFWPIFERAQALDVPVYIHPGPPHPVVVETYYKEYVKDFPNILTAGWGYTVEAATQGLRFVLSGIFDAYPRLKIILGHLGEGLPFLTWRIDAAFSRAGNRPVSFRKEFCEHFYVTTSGNFSDPALLCCVQELGVDRILFAVDWPFVVNTQATKWMESVPLCKEDREKILGGNSKRLFRM